MIADERSSADIGQGGRSLRIAAIITVVQVLSGYAIFVFLGSFSYYTSLAAAPIVTAWLPGILWGNFLDLSHGASSGLLSPMVLGTSVGIVTLIAAFVILRARYAPIACWTLLALQISCLVSVMDLGLYYINPSQDPSARMAGFATITVFGAIPSIVPMIVCSLLLGKVALAAIRSRDVRM